MQYSGKYNGVNVHASVSNKATFRALGYDEEFEKQEDLFEFLDSKED